MKKLIMIFLLMSTASASSDDLPLSKQMKDTLISERIESKIGMRVVEINYSRPDGFIGNIAKAANGLAKMAGEDLFIEEVHILTNTGLVLNCNAQFDNNKEEIIVLSQCNIYDKDLTSDKEALIGALKL